MTTPPSTSNHPEAGDHPRPSSGLHLAEVSIRYGSRTVVDQLSFDVRAGESIALVGPSGAGKSSVLGAIMGTVKHTGTITVAGATANRKTASDRAGTPSASSFNTASCSPSSLDSAMRDQVLHALHTTSKDTGAALVIVTHEAHVAASADHQVELPPYR